MVSCSEKRVLIRLRLFTRLYLDLGMYVMYYATCTHITEEEARGGGSQELSEGAYNDPRRPGSALPRVEPQILADVSTLSRLDENLQPNLRERSRRSVDFKSG
jgi:hypothetical protein